MKFFAVFKGLSSMLVLVFHSNSKNIQNFGMALIFFLMHSMSSYISTNACKTQGSYRMRCFLQVFQDFNDFFPSFQGAFLHFDFFLLILKIEKCPLKTVKKVTKMLKIWRKRLLPIISQGLTRI